MPRKLWIGGRIQAPIYVTDLGPLRPDIVVWIDTGSGKIVESELTEPAVSAATLATCLSKAIRSRKAGSPPDRVRVEDAVLAAAIRKVVGQKPAVEIAPTPELFEVAASFAGFMDSRNRVPGGGEDASYFENGRVAPGTVTRLFESAAQLYRVAPWDLLWDADVIGLDLPQYGLYRAVLSVIGRAGENYGFVIFDSARDFDSFGSRARDVFREETDLGAATLSLNFETKSRIPSPMRREIARHRWTVAGPKAHPFVMAVDRDRVMRPLVERDVRLVSAVAESLAQFISKHRDRLSPEMTETIVEEYPVRVEEDLTVRLQAPHPEMPWFVEDDNLDGVDLEAPDADQAFEEEDEEAVEKEFREIANDFVEAQRTLGRSESWLEAAGFVAWTLLGYKANYVGGPPDQLSERDAEGFLIDHFPRKVTAEDETVARTPEALVAFYDWLAERGRITTAVAAAVRARVSAVRDRFLAAARDPSRFGPAKSFFMQMESDGVDISDAAAVEAYVVRYNARLVASRSAPPARIDESAAGLRLSPRWVPAPGAEAPAPKAPCPCGSGRAFRRCCMRR